MSNPRFEFNDELPKVPMIRNCGLCFNQGNCIAYKLYKEQVEPQINGAKEYGLNAENLALGCKMYLEKEIPQAPIKKTYSTHRED